MSFTSKRGRPASAETTVNLSVIQGGKVELPQPEPVRNIRFNREPVDICLEKGIISPEEHWAAIHFRWLYTLKFGAPGISAMDPERAFGGRSNKAPEAEWQAEREKEYAMGIEKLRKTGALKMVLNLAVFGHFPKFLFSAGGVNKMRIQANFAEVTKLREGLQTLASHWGKRVL